jgi:hypothetical protein
MFVGHLALALGAKRIDPEVPLGAAVAAAFGLDLVWPVFLLAGIEVVRVSPGDTAFTNLAFESYPWTHSLAMALVWAIGAGLVAGRLLRSRRLGVILGSLVLSHWALDVVTHRPDLPLWPRGPVVGLGLWNSVVGTFAVEGALLAAGVAAYLSATRAEDRVGSLGFYGLLALCFLVWATQPWVPPPPDATAVALGALILWIVPPWSRWVDRHRSLVAGG